MVMLTRLRLSSDVAMARLLVVEDHTDVCEVLAEGLLAHGFDVVTAGSAAAARVALDSQSFDVMIADMVMPGGCDGNLANHAATKGARVILMSGHPDRFNETHEAFAFLTKPFSIGALLDVVQRALANSPRAEARRADSAA
jgi:DNA-binding NtrC family response regulator